MSQLFWTATLAFGSLWGAEYAPPPSNALAGAIIGTSDTAQQVQLEITIARINRTALPKAVLEWMENEVGLGSKQGACAMVEQAKCLDWLRAMNADGIAETLASPRVLTLSGRKARVEIGMELAPGVPVAANKYAGIKLEMLPTLKGDGKVQVTFDAELKGIEQGKFRATAEWALGKTVAIRSARELKSEPLIDCPLIGSLLRQVSETETLLLVTARLVKDAPAAFPPASQLPEPRPFPLAKPMVSKKAIYLVTEGGPVEKVLAIPAADNQTLLDVLAESKQFMLQPPKKIWVARPSAPGKADTILNADWRTLTDGTGPNHVLLPGDRIYLVANAPVVNAGHTEESEHPRVTAAGNNALAVAMKAVIGPDCKACTNTMTIADVVRLAKKGISNDVIVRQMELTKTVFNLSVDDIIALHDAGVGDTLIRAMQERREGLERAPSASSFYPIR